MNKSEELAVMKMRAKIKVEELKKQHEQSWNGKEPIVIDKNAATDNSINSIDDLGENNGLSR